MRWWHICVHTSILFIAMLKGCSHHASCPSICFTHHMKFPQVTVDTLSLPAFKSRFPTVALHLGVVSSVDPSRHTLEFTPYEGVASTLHFSKLCIACGSSPLPGPLPSLRWTLEPFVHTIRDRSSVLSLSTLSKDAAKRVAVVGNGGVAMEVVHALTSLPSGERHRAAKLEELVGFRRLTPMIS